MQCRDRVARSLQRARRPMATHRSRAPTGASEQGRARLGPQATRLDGERARRGGEGSSGDQARWGKGEA